MRSTIMYLACWTIAALSAYGQVSVSLQLPFATRMSGRIAEWQENESLIRIVVQNTGNVEYPSLVLSAELTKDGRRIARTREGHGEQPRFSLSAGETRVLTWREAISERALEYDKSIEQAIAITGELPEGNYQLCLQVLETTQRRPISPVVCGTFVIQLADPPQLISPINCDKTDVMPLMQWSPSTPAPPGLMYRLTIKVRYRGQTPAQAMASNPVQLTVDVPTTTYQIPVSHQLGGDAADPNYESHVWQVQAFLNGRPYGRNRGQSSIGCFVVPPMVVDPAPPESGPVVAWEIPYEDLLSRRVVLEPPPSPPQDSVTFVIHIKVPKHLSLEQIERLLGEGSAPADTLRGNYKGGFVYSFSGDSVQPAVLQGFREATSEKSVDLSSIVDSKNRGTSIRGRIERGRIKLNEPVDIIRGTIIMSGVLCPTELVLPVMDIAVVADTLVETASTPSLSDALKYTGYVLIQAVASGAGRASGKTLARQAGSGSPRGPRAVGPRVGDQILLHERISPRDTASPPGPRDSIICWLPPLEPGSGQSPVGVVGEVADDGITVAFRPWPGWLQDFLERRKRVYVVMTGAVR